MKKMWLKFQKITVYSIGSGELFPEFVDVPEFSLIDRSLVPSLLVTYCNKSISVTTPTTTSLV